MTKPISAKVIEAYRFPRERGSLWPDDDDPNRDGGIGRWLVPSPAAALARSSETWGEQYDPFERRKVTGGLPMVWPRVTLRPDGEAA